MPVIRFVREGRDVECYPGENLREVALREGKMTLEESKVRLRSYEAGLSGYTYLERED